MAVVSLLTRRQRDSRLQQTEILIWHPNYVETGTCHVSSGDTLNTRQATPRSLSAHTHISGKLKTSETCEPYTPVRCSEDMRDPAHLEDLEELQNYLIRLLIASWH